MLAAASFRRCRAARAYAEVKRTARRCRILMRSARCCTCKALAPNARTFANIRSRSISSSTAAAFTMLCAAQNQSEIWGAAAWHVRGQLQAVSEATAAGLSLLLHWSAADGTEWTDATPSFDAVSISSMLRSLSTKLTAMCPSPALPPALLLGGLAKAPRLR